MEHSFDVDIAKKYGVNVAILIESLYFQIEKNRANGKHYHDGTYWTYNSVRAFSKMFPYLSEKQIRFAIQKMLKDELIITGNYNEDNRDRTIWYALTEKGCSEIQQNSILQKVHTGMYKMSNENVQNVKPLPNNKNNIVDSEKIDEEFEELWKLYPNKQGKANAKKDYKKARKGKPEMFDTVRQGLENYLAHIQKTKTEPKYIKHGSTWFHQECWNDVYECETAKEEKPSDGWGKVGCWL